MSAITMPGSRFLTAIILVILTGCVPFPKPSTGGFAAHYLFSPAYQKTLFRNNYNFIQSQKLCALVRQTTALARTRARKCYPARFKLLELLGKRIAQEIAGGLPAAAREDLDLYRNNLLLIRRLNNNLKGHKGCPRPVKHPCWEYLKSRYQ